jgi:hypothetical protein
MQPGRARHFALDQKFLCTKTQIHVGPARVGFVGSGDKNPVGTSVSVGRHDKTEDKTKSDSSDAKSSDTMIARDKKSTGDNSINGQQLRE